MRGGIRIWMIPLTAWVMIASAPASTAKERSIDDLLGRWCGTTTDYTFTRTRLTVRFHQGGENRILEIGKVNASEDWIEVIWKPPYKNTIFEKFSADKQQMFQKANDTGDMGPRREFHRCR